MGFVNCLTLFFDVSNASASYALLANSADCFIVGINAANCLCML